VAPSSVPVRKTPDITDIVGEKGEKEKGEREKGEKEKGEDVMIPSATETVSQPNEPQPNIENTITSSSNHLITSSSNHLITPSSNHFPTHWQTMFDQVFASVPIIYIPLKESLPEVENNIVKVVVKNDIQKEHFETKTREVLEYLRTHYDEQIENVVVETNELLETKKIIYDTKDKLQNFKEQNEEFEDFLQILDLKIKE
jgi:hypothetical protein